MFDLLALWCFKPREKIQSSSNTPIKSPNVKNQQHNFGPDAYRRGSTANTKQLNNQVIDFDALSPRNSKNINSNHTSSKIQKNTSSPTKNFQKNPISKTPQLSAPAKAINLTNQVSSSSSNSASQQQQSSLRNAQSVKGTSDSPSGKPKFDYAKTVKEKRELRRYASGIVPSTERS